MGLAARGRFPHASVTKVRGARERVRRPPARHQLAAERGDEHISRSVQRTGKTGLENFHRFAVQPRAVADLLSAASVRLGVMNCASAQSARMAVTNSSVKQP